MRMDLGTFFGRCSPLATGGSRYSPARRTRRYAVTDADGAARCPAESGSRERHDCRIESTATGKAEDHERLLDNAEGIAIGSCGACISTRLHPARHARESFQPADRERGSGPNPRRFRLPTSSRRAPYSGRRSGAANGAEGREQARYAAIPEKIL
jgi:hypothetical protein